MGHSSNNIVSFDCWKKKGDEIFYQTVRNDHLASVVYVHRMSQALSYYYKASALAVTADEKATIANGLGVLQFKCGKRLYSNYKINISTLPKNDHKDARLLIEYYLKEALIQFERAWKFSDNDVKFPEWRENLLKTWSECVTLLLAVIVQFVENIEEPFSAQVARFEVFLQSIEGFSRGFFSFCIADIICQEAAELQAAGDHRNSVKLLRDNSSRVDYAIKAFNDAKFNYLISEMEELRLTSEKLLNVAESLFAKEKGDACWISIKVSLNETLGERVGSQDSEELPDYVLSAVDWYKTAINLARSGQSLEAEAKAHVQLGQIYEGRVNDKSLKHYEMAEKLAIEMGIAKNEDWYRPCLKGLNRLKTLQQWQENRDRESLRAPVRKQLAAQLAELEKAGRKPIEELIAFIYQKYPPKGHGMEKPAGTNWKMNLRKALLHYHPDKQNLYRFGLHWMILAEEITVVLNRQFARLFKN